MLLSAVLLAVALTDAPGAAGAAGFENVRNAPPKFRFDGKQALILMSFNIRVGYGAGSHGTDPFTLSRRREKLAPVIAEVRSRNPHIVALQEVAGPGQAGRIARALNMNHAYAGHATGCSQPSWWGVALLSKFPIAAAQDFPISFGRGNSKSALQCTVRVADRTMTVLSIHMDRDIRDARPLSRVMERVRRISGPVVLMGDFNMRPDDARLEILKARFDDSARGAGGRGAWGRRRTDTFPGVGRIDYIWIDRVVFNVKAAGPADRRFRKASDHLAWWAEAIPASGP